MEVGLQYYLKRMSSVDERERSTYGHTEVWYSKRGVS
jgi:hypothetical protein